MKSLRLLTLFLAPIGVAEVFVVQDSRWLTHAALGADHKVTGDAEMHEEPQIILCCRYTLFTML